MKCWQTLFRIVMRIFIFLFFSTGSYSQKSLWNIESCIDYALDNNLDIKIANLDIYQGKITNDQSKYNYLPSINGGATHGYNWGQSIDPFTNQFASNRVRSNSIYLGSSLTLFSGLRNYYTNQRNCSQYLVQKYIGEIQKRNTKILISSLFLQALMDFKTIEITKQQINYSLVQKKRIKELVKQNTKISFDLIEAESQLGLDSLALTEAKNNYRLSMFKLKQALNLNNGSEFEIDTSVLTKKYKPKEIQIDFRKIEETLLKNEEIKVTDKNIKIAQSEYYPSLIFSGSLGSGYSGNNKQLIGNDFVPKSINDQFKENFYQTAYLSLSIPIFNGNRINSQVKIAKIESQKIQLEQEKALIETEMKIIQIRIEIDNASNKIRSLKKVISSLKVNLERAKYKLLEGIINYSQYVEAKNSLLKSELELLQTQFEFIFKNRILSYYSKSATE